MEIEIHLDLEEAAPENYEKIRQRLTEWHAEGAMTKTVSAG